jgi:competence protein ComEC
MTSFYSRPVIPLLMSLACGIALGSKYPGYSLWAGGVILLCAGMLLYLIVRNQSAKSLPLLLFLVLGYLSLQPWVYPSFPPNHLIHYLDDRRWDIEGVITDHPLMANNRQKLKLQVQRLGHDGDFFSVVGGLRVTAVGDAPVLNRGDRILINSRLRSLRNFRNPGGFDYKRYMYFQGICATAYIQGRRVTILERHRSHFWSDMIENTRHRIGRIIASTGKGSQSAVLKALIVGDRSHITQGAREAFNRAGVGHLLAISGLHIGIVATMAFLFFQRMLSNIKPLLWRAWTRKTAALLALIPVWFYGFISGFSPSTQRAVIMVSVFLMTFLFEREHDIMNTIALAAVAILVIFPPSIYSISFQLSFSAVLAIIFGFTCVNKLHNPGNDRDRHPLMQTLKKRLIDFLWVSVFAIGGTLPLVMHYFNQVSLVGIVANLIVVPLVGFTVVPLGLIAVFLSSFCFNCAAWCFTVCGTILKFSLKLIEVFSGFEFAAVKTFTPTVLEIGCYYVLFWAVLSLIQKHHSSADGNTQSGGAGTKSPAPARKEYVFRKIHILPSRYIGLVADTVGYLKVQKTLFTQRKFIATIAAVITFVLICDAGYWLYYRLWHQNLRITIIDVGQGNAALLELPDGYTMLIDGGGFSDNSIFDIGARVVAPFLWRKKIETIDTLVLTHPNSDHLNGLIYIAEHFKVQKMWTNSEARDTLGYRKLMGVIARRGIVLPDFEQLPRKQIVNGVEINVLYPPDDFIEKKGSDKWRNTNNNSMVIRVSLGSISFLFPGDIMAEAEKELVDISQTKLTSTVLLAPHHGSRSSSSELFLDGVAPQIVAISSGWKNSFKFPHTAVLQQYRQRGYQVFRTDTCGAITFITDGDQLAVEPFVAGNSN